MKQGVKQQGQVMLITVLAMSGTVLASTAIAGLLMVYQIRQSTDTANSAKAIFAADAGLEWEFYRILVDPYYQKPIFENKADFEVTCESTITEKKSDSITEIITIRSSGNSFGNLRAFEAGFTHEVFVPTCICDNSCGDE